nr:hypothetical protein [Micromonospora sp. DSM 115978]
TGLFVSALIAMSLFDNIEPARRSTSLLVAAAVSAGAVAGLAAAAAQGTSAVAADLARAGSPRQLIAADRSTFVRVALVHGIVVGLVVAATLGVVVGLVNQRSTAMELGSVALAAVLTALPAALAAGAAATTWA